MVKVFVDDVLLADSKDTVFVEGNHYFPPESLSKDVPFKPSTTEYVVDPDSCLMFYFVDIDICIGQSVLGRGN